MEETGFHPVESYITLICWERVRDDRDAVIIIKGGRSLCSFDNSAWLIVATGCFALEIDDTRSIGFNGVIVHMRCSLTGAATALGRPDLEWHCRVWF